MAGKALAAVAQAFRGIAAALRTQAKVVWGVTAAVAAFNLVAPVAILSLARRPFDFFTFNPWLSRLPEYLRSDEPLAKKLSAVSAPPISGGFAFLLTNMITREISSRKSSVTQKSITM